MRRRQEEEAKEKAKQDEIKAAADAKKAQDLAYKQSIKDLIELCAETLAGSNFDRFWVEGNQRKLFQTKDKVDTYIAYLTQIQAKNDVDQADKIEQWTAYVEEMSQTDA